MSREGRLDLWVEVLWDFCVSRSWGDVEGEDGERRPGEGQRVGGAGKGTTGEGEDDTMAKWS